MSTITLTDSTLTDSPPLSVVERAVRFHDECVLIPEPPPRSRLPRLVTKSYSLPLWKRRQGEQLIPTATDIVPGSPPPVVEVEDFVGIKLSVPTFTTKVVSSPSKDVISPQRLQSCLARQNALSKDSGSSGSQDDDPHVRRPPARRASMPLPIRTDLITVPLRPCCAACEAIVEKSTKEEWKEKFTKGARRRRNSSSDTPRTLVLNEEHNHNHNHHHHRGVTTSSTFAIIVDEIDQRRKSSDGPRLDDVGEVALADGDVKLAVPLAHLTIPIQEEDEDQLFPLPSPKRTPNASPIPSPNASSYTLNLHGSKDEGSVGTSKNGLSKSNVRSSPPLSSPRILPQSAPLPSRADDTMPRAPLDTAFLEADRLLSSPDISRASRSSTSPTSPSKKYSNAFTRVGSGILKGVNNSFGSPPTL